MKNSKRRMATFQVGLDGLGDLQRTAASDARSIAFSFIKSISSILAKAEFREEAIYVTGCVCVSER